MASNNLVNPNWEDDGAITSANDSDGFAWAVGVGLLMIELVGAAALLTVVSAWSRSAPALPPMQPAAHIEFVVGDGTTIVRGNHFSAGEAVELFLKPSANAPFVQFVKLGEIAADGEGNFVAELPASQRTVGGYVIARGASSGFTLPIGPIAVSPEAQQNVASSIEVAPTETPAPTPIPWPTPWPTPLPPPPDTDPIGQWYGEYFANRDLHDAPVMTRNDGFLDFNWGTGAPADVLPRDNFSARWIRREWFDRTENYQFTLVVDDGARVFFDDQLIINEWRIGPCRIVKANVPVVRGEHRLRVEYYAATGGAFISLNWRVNYSVWEGRYYNTPDFTGAVGLKRDDGNADGFLDADWGEGGPGYGLNNDNFSVNWERRVLFPVTGEYRFNLEADDGARVYVDGQLLFDHLGGPGAFEARRTLPRGRRFVQVQYVERGGHARIKLTWAPVAPEAAPAS